MFEGMHLAGNVRRVVGMYLSKMSFLVRRLAHLSSRMQCYSFIDKQTVSQMPPSL